MRLGIDLGGTKIEGVTISTQGEITNRHRVDTPRDDYEATLDAVRDLADQLAPDRSIPLGIGTPGSISRVSGLLRGSNSTCLNDKPIREDLSAHLHRDVRVANDADCFTLSEAMDGAASGHHLVFGVILGTGVGGGICHAGNLLAGINGISGEWGHNALDLSALQKDVDFEPRDCFCGLRNCVETWCSGPALEKSYLEATGRRLEAREIVAACAAGDDAARDVLDTHIELVTLALSGVINIIDPDVIVLGGGLSNIDALYTEIPARWGKCVFSEFVDTKLVRAQHGDSSGVRDAAWLWPR